MFAHGSSDCHLGWQMIKRVNQGQSWKWQGERVRRGVCAAPGGTRLRRRAGLAAARAEPLLQPQGRRRRWRAERHWGNPAHTRWEFYTKSLSVHLARCSSLTQGRHVPARSTCASPAEPGPYELLAGRSYGMNCTPLSCRHWPSNLLWEVFNCCVQLSPTEKWREAYKSKLIIPF